MSTTDWPDVGMVMAALTALLILSGVALAPTVAFLVIALVSLRGTQPADRPTILRGLATLKRRGDDRIAGWWRVWSSRDQAQLNDRKWRPARCLAKPGDGCSAWHAHLVLVGPLGELTNYLGLLRRAQRRASVLESWGIWCSAIDVIEDAAGGSRWRG
jgi:hypothetical protein